MDKKAEWALVGAAWFLALSVAGLGWLAWRHFNPGPSDPRAVYALHDDGSAICPVTGRRLQIDANTPKVDYQGHVYYFANDVDAQGLDARTRFLMDPESYLSPKRP